MAVVVSLCGGRLLQLQGFDSSAYAAISNESLTRTLTMLPTRGQIFDRNGEVLASSEPAVNITADPTYTAPKADQIAAVLDSYLDVGHDAIFAALTKPGTRFSYVAKGVPAATFTKINSDLTALDLYGVFREQSPIRTYPGGATGSGVVGFVNGLGVGQSGLEARFNAQLSGAAGQEIYQSAPNGSKIPLGTNVITPAKDGTSYTTTIDSELQWVAERRLAAQIKTTKASSGFVITMNVKTGEILAMASAPGFDPNDIGIDDGDNTGNHAISDAYEPGSVEKVLTSAALIDSGTTNPDTHVRVPPSISSGGGRIKDHYVHDTIDLTMRGVVANSSNIGTVEMTRTMDVATLHQYLTSFGLGQKTGIELPGESTGSLPPATMPGYTRDQLSFGQGLSLTGVQMASAISGIVNGGVLNPPTILKSSTAPDGTTASLQREAPRRVVSEATSAQVRDLMQAVVYHGSKNLQVPQYTTGGKTGTAERVSGKHGGRYDSYTTSYVGFAPADDPQILTYVVITDPKGSASGSGTAAPVFTSVMSFALPRYAVTPSTTKVEEKALTY
jgi:cell division protein FtsI (penicillin-binding protein 3)